ncbi:MAG: penicillin-binding protein activator, partial [Pseudomonadales bacterium]|nr:penicillin-binding protein activator [Pseudomonadales bacterium]
SHPATRLMPTSLQMLSSVVQEQPRIIALLLPLQGNLAPYGRAIRDGVLGAHYELAGKAAVRVYDTSALDVSNVIFAAINEGAELIIGPLSRENVTRVVQIPYLAVPVLALNRTVDGSTHPDVYQFGLAPEDEMIQVANQIFEEGHRNALAIYPSDDWGIRNFEAFRTEWESLGGVIVESAPFSNRRDYSDLIKSVLNVDKSEQRATNLRRITGQRFEFNARRRQDVDFVFLLANQSQARGINPTLAFFFAEDLPVYSSSHVYEHSKSKIDAIDLNGIRFCDIPWKLTRTGPVQEAIQSTWPAAKAQLAAFYALGVDAYRVFPRLQQLKQIPDQRVFGATGVLRLNERNEVIRDLMWAQFREGEIVSAPMVVGTVQRGYVDE